MPPRPMEPLPEPLIEQATAIFRALGDSSRLRLLRALLDAGAPLSQGAAAKAAGLSQANASKHLAFLVREGLVSRTQEGNTAFFEVVAPLVPDLCGLVCGFVARRAQTRYEALG